MILASVNIISIGCFLLRTNSNIVMYHVAEVEINNPDPSGKTHYRHQENGGLLRFFPLIIQSLLVKKEFKLVLIWDGIML